MVSLVHPDRWLPPVRLHDLRHGAASLAHCAGVDLKTVQAQLGHSSIVLTADTYTSVLTDLLAYAAEATAKLVLAAAARNPGHQHRRTITRQNPLDRPKQEDRNGPQAGVLAAAGAARGAAHTRPTDVPQRSRPHSSMAIRPGKAGAPRGT